MKNKEFIITINTKDDIEKLKELGINNYAWPLKDFCVGIPKTFNLFDIPKKYLKNSYLYLNRVLDNQSIDKLKEILLTLPPNLKGLIFDDLGVLEIVKDLTCEKILFLNHFNCNYASIALYLEYVDSVIISSDITYEEIKEITQKFPHKLTGYVLGYAMAMYSRRYLIDNYAKYHHLTKENPLTILNDSHGFILYENPYGTAFYYAKVFNGLRLLDLPLKYFFINSVFLSVQDIQELLNNTSKIESDNGFLDKETIYKLKGDKE